MADLELVVISMRYSSWSMRPWLALTHAGVDFTTRTVEPTLGHQSPATAPPAAGRTRGTG